MRTERANGLLTFIITTDQTGSIDMEMDEETVTLRQGDVLVQRGTIHNWVSLTGKYGQKRSYG